LIVVDSDWFEFTDDLRLYSPDEYATMKSKYESVSLSAFYELADYTTEESELIVVGNVSKAAAYLCRALSPRENDAPKNGTAAKRRMSAEQVLDFITYQYMEELTVSEVAERMGYSVCSFCRIVKREFGKSFHVLLNEARIKKACSLLYDTDLPIYRIAREVGFSEAKSFCRVFKSIKGKLLQTDVYR
jgi:AraC-like DNA-binding protein